MSHRGAGVCRLTQMMMVSDGEWVVKCVNDGEFNPMIEVTDGDA